VPGWPVRQTAAFDPLQKGRHSSQISGYQSVRASDGSTMTGRGFSIDIQAISRHAISATGINRDQVSAEFSEHAEEELRHAMMAAERVSQHGGQPDFDPTTLAARAHTTYEAPDDSDLTGMLKENLIAERIVISAYQEIIGWLGDGDITTRRMLESILAEEEEHADDMLDLLGTLRG
jgi:bacterioferritin (cytochrome b1)